MKTTITTTTSVNSSWIQSTNTKSLLKKQSHNSHSRISLQTIPKPSLIVKCSQNGKPPSENNGSFKNLLTGLVDEKVEQLLNKEENRVLLDGLDQAPMRVEMAKKALAEIEKQDAEAKITRDYINQLELRASESLD